MSRPSFIFDYLIKTQQVDQADEVWRFLGQIDPELREDRRLNLVADGGFEGKYLNGGFGWRAEPSSQVDVSLDTSQFHSGTGASKTCSAPAGGGNCWLISRRDRKPD